MIEKVMCPRCKGKGIVATQIYKGGVIEDCILCKGKGEVDEEEAHKAIMEQLNKKR